MNNEQAKAIAGVVACAVRSDEERMAVESGITVALVRAIAAERARCSGIARGLKIEGEPTPETLRMGRWAAYNRACEEIAQAIEREISHGIALESVT